MSDLRSADNLSISSPLISAKNRGVHHRSMVIMMKFIVKSQAIGKQKKVKLGKVVGNSINGTFVKDSSDMTMATGVEDSGSIDSFKALFAVPLDCQSCVDSVSKALKGVSGISRFNVDLKKQTVSVEGDIAPSQVLKLIQSTGRDAIIRGTGEPNSAAVCIFETFDPKYIASPIRGLARLVSSSNGVLVDLTLNGLPPGRYYPSFRESGDLSRQGSSVGKSIGDLGEVIVRKDGTGQAYLRQPFKIYELIGRSMAVTDRPDGQLDETSIMGVIARSAGVWQNEKTVCSCSGKQMWQERKDSLAKGLL